MQKPKILLVEDSPSLAEIYKQYLKNEGVNLFHASTVRDALRYLANTVPHLILLDLKLDDFPGENVLKHVKENGIPCAVVVITAHGSVDVAVKLLHLGASDFLQKPIEATRLLTTVRNNLENVSLKNLVNTLTEDMHREHYLGFIGTSAVMQGIYRTIDSVACSDAAVFITGESGTGKEVCAEAIHTKSRRNQQAFIALNCGAIPRDLMESEIFGHQKGAFTGANSDRKGAASLADGGTLFLDEIGEMDMNLQTKLLRFVQTGMIKKVGGNQEEKVNVRIICATNREPLSEIAAGRFREDLYYRLNVLPLHLPPLRERDNDVVQLALHFLLKYSSEESKPFERLSAEVEQLFIDYEWPGNVRQLQNVIRNIVVLHNDITVELAHLPMPFGQTQTQTEIRSRVDHQHKWNPKVESNGGIRPLAIVEREAIEQAINACDGNIPKAAALLDVSPSTIYRKKQGWDS